MNGMKNKLYAIGVTILMMTSCTQDELISSDNGREPVTAGSCLTLVSLLLCISMVLPLCTGAIPVKAAESTKKVVRSHKHILTEKPIADTIDRISICVLKT